jgi:hypothetical protein
VKLETMAYLISLPGLPFIVPQPALQNEYQALGFEDMSYRIDSNRDAPAQHTQQDEMMRGWVGIYLMACCIWAWF